MGKRFNVMTPRPKQDGGSWWHKVGNAFENDRGLVTVYLDSVPVPDQEKNNKIVMMLFEPEENQEPRTSGGKSGRSNIRESSSQAKAAGKGKGKKQELSEELDDEIPF